MLNLKKKVFFVSDHHFGVTTTDMSSKEREKLFVKFLEKIKPEASEVIFMGDLFDFWFEYKTVIQKGYVRLLGKIAEFVDDGIPVSYFRGNHDIWAFSYLNDEIGMKLYRKPEIRTILGKNFYLAHGDGLGDGDKGYKFLKKVFECKFNQWLFRWVHPDFSTSIAFRWSKRSRYANQAKTKKDEAKHGLTSTEISAKKRLPEFCQSVKDKEKNIDYFVFGHYHAPLQFATPDNTPIFTIGDWIVHFTYGVFDGEKFELKSFINN